MTGMRITQGQNEIKDRVSMADFVFTAEDLQPRSPMFYEKAFAIVDSPR